MQHGSALSCVCRIRNLAPCRVPRCTAGMLCGVVALLRLPDSELLLAALCGVLAWSLQSSGLVSWRPLPSRVMAATCQEAADGIAAVVQLEVTDNMRTAFPVVLLH